MSEPMLEVAGLAAVVAAVVVGAAFGAEGRLGHLVRTLLGAAPRETGFDAVVSIPRDEGEWNLLPGAREQAAEQAAARAAARAAALAGHAASQQQSIHA